MSHDLRDWDGTIEPERYELSEGPAYRFALDRREFLRTLGGGFVVLLALDETEDLLAQESGGGRRGFGDAMPKELSAWIHIDERGAVDVYTGKTEVGQNIRTSLSQVVADELGTPLESIRVIMADTDLTPYDAGTFGSRTTPTMAPQLRKVAAATRELLVEKAAEKWSLPQEDRARLRATDGKIHDPGSGRSATFAELTRGEKLVRAVRTDIRVTPAAGWKVAGDSLPKVDGRAFVTGAHRFTTDVHRPGQMYGKVLRPPSFGAVLESLDASAAESMPGVTVVRDGGFAGVAAADADTAARALAALRPSWKESADAVSSAGVYEHLKRTASPSRGAGQGTRGSIDDGLAAADVKLESTYTVAYIAHAPLEPRAAVAEWDAGKLTVWTGTQRPFGVRSELAEAFHVPEERVRVIVPDTGSGYGGKHTGEAALEAARLARAAGHPVKLVWTREEEFTWAYFRPAGVIEVRSGARKDGRVTAWEFHNYNSGGSAIAPMYDFANQKIEFHPSRSPLRQGSYRGLAATANHFARESHMDELARALSIDPLDFRLRNIADPRLRAVLEAAAERFGWQKRRRSERTGFGIAAGFEKGSYVAACAQVDCAGPDKTRIVRVVTAFECGAIVNPDHLRNQVEGSVVMAIGGALFESIEFSVGKIVNARFSSYRVPRFSDTPEIDVVLLDRKDLPSAGAGETPIVGLAPAVANAICDATGVRLRRLPLQNGAAKIPAG